MRLCSILIGVLVLGCDSPKPPTDSAAASIANAKPRVNGSAASGNSAAPSCPPTGKWEVCSVEKRLRQSGFVAKRVRDEVPQRPWFAVTPVVYTLGRARLEVFIYANEIDLGRDMASVDTVTAVPPGTISPWEVSPVLIRSMNLAAVLLTDNHRQAERLTLALTAGAPQPNPGR